MSKMEMDDQSETRGIDVFGIAEKLTWVAIAIVVVLLLVYSAHSVAQHVMTAFQATDGPQ